MPQDNTEVLREAMTLQSHSARDPMRVDHETGKILGVRFHASESRNNRIYSEAAMNDLKRLYNKVPVRIGHDKKEWHDTIGSATAHHDIVDGAIYGDLELLQKHSQYNTIMEGAEKQPHLLKISHEVPARKYEAERRPDGKLLVKRIYAVDCLAIVTDGGVNKTLFESRQEDEEDDMEVKTAAELKEKYPALVEELVKASHEAQADSDKLIEAIQARDHAKAELATLQAELTKLQEEKAQDAKRKLIRDKAAKLSVVCEDDLVEMLLPDDEAKIERILKGQPAIREDGGAEKNPPAPEEKPEQKSGLRTSQPFSYEPRYNRLGKFLSTKS